MSRDRSNFLVRINQLEEENEKLNYLYHTSLDDYIKQFDELQRYKRALDKACDMLSKNATDSDGYSYKKEQWKEECMKDE